MIRRAAWEAALANLFEDEYIFISSGPRAQEAWEDDVLAVVFREVGDPQGWTAQDWDATEEPGQRKKRAGYPFIDFTRDYLQSHLFRVAGGVAIRQLVAMADEWFTMSNIPNFSTRQNRFTEDARTLLSRYGSDAAFYSSSIDARATAEPYLVPEKAVNGGYSFTELLMDLGLVAVGDSEVGVFWRFNAY